MSDAEEDEEAHKRLKKTVRKPPADARQQKFKPFIPAAFEMVCDTDNKDAIRFSEDGTQVEILDIARFSDVVLPKFFKHKNLSSFIRQLNMYGFIKCDAHGPAKHTFMHEYFQRDHRELIAKIERKSVKTKKSDSEHELDESLLDSSRIEAHAAAEELSKLKQNQLAHEDRIRMLERENSTLTEENKRIRSAIVQVKSAQQAMTERLRQLFLYFLKFYVREGQLSEADLSALMTGDGNVMAQLEDEKQKEVVNSFLKLQNGSVNDSPSVPDTLMTTTTTMPAISGEDFSNIFEDDPGTALLGRSHSLASNASLVLSHTMLPKDLEEHIDRNGDTMRRIDTLASTVAGTAGGSFRQGDMLDRSVFDEDFEGQQNEEDDDDDEEELTRS